MPSSPGYKRDYAQERRTAIKRGETSKGSSSGDAQRHRARRILEKKLGNAALKGKDVDHIRTIQSGGTNAASNLRTRSVHSNRSSGGKSGNTAGKSRGGALGRK